MGGAFFLRRTWLGVTFYISYQHASETTHIESTRREGNAMDTTTLIIVIVVLLLLFGGGGFWYRGRRR